MIIGLTGTKASGKGSVANLLQEKGFAYSSTSDRVREEAVSRGLEDYTIEQLQDIGNELRETHGTGVLAKMTLEKLKGEENSVIDGIRNLGEIEVLRQQPNFYLIGVDAPQEIRFSRLLHRGRASDPKTWEGFLEMEARDHGKGEKSSGQQTKACIGEADYFFWSEYYYPEKPTKGLIRGNEDIAMMEFLKGKHGFLNLFGESKRRPTFDEVFMRQAYEWSNRSTCLSRHTGAVLVDEDNTLISQGYNGAPRGVGHCADRGGCERRKRNIPSGERLELCFAVHAEVNALYNSKQSVAGATMYATTHPCNDCSKVIIQKGVKKVIYMGDYKSELGEIMLREAGVEMQRYRRGVSPKAYPRFWTPDFFKG